jgi:hypothetical protein
MKKWQRQVAPYQRPSCTHGGLLLEVMLPASSVHTAFRNVRVRNHKRIGRYPKPLTRFPRSAKENSGLEQEINLCA